MIGLGHGFDTGGGIAAQSLGAEFGEAEIQNLDAVPGDDDVAGLQVAMDHAFGVRGGQCIDDLHRITAAPYRAAAGPAR